VDSRHGLVRYRNACEEVVPGFGFESIENGHQSQALPHAHQTESMSIACNLEIKQHYFEHAYGLKITSGCSDVCYPTIILSTAERK